MCCKKVIKLQIKMAKCQIQDRQSYAFNETERKSSSASTLIGEFRKKQCIFKTECPFLIMTITKT